MAPFVPFSYVTFNSLICEFINDESSKVTSDGELIVNVVKLVQLKNAWKSKLTYPFVYKSITLTFEYENDNVLKSILPIEWISKKVKSFVFLNASCINVTVPFV